MRHRRAAAEIPPRAAHWNASKHKGWPDDHPIRGPSPCHRWWGSERGPAAGMGAAHTAQGEHPRAVGWGSMDVVAGPQHWHTGKQQETKPSQQRFQLDTMAREIRQMRRIQQHYRVPLGQEDLLNGGPSSPGLVERRGLPRFSDISPRHVASSSRPTYHEIQRAKCDSAVDGHRGRGVAECDSQGLDPQPTSPLVGEGGKAGKACREG